MTEQTKAGETPAEKDQDNTAPRTQQLVDLGSAVTRTAHGNIYCLTVVGQIEGHMLLPNTQKATKYEHVLPLLAYLEESKEIDGVLREALKHDITSQLTGFVRRRYAAPLRAEACRSTPGCAHGCQAA